jgi:hypothetical protein
VRDQSENLDLNGRMLLKCILGPVKIWLGEWVVYLSDLGYRSVADFCEHCNETTSSIKCWKCFKHLMYFSQARLCPRSSFVITSLFLKKELPRDVAALICLVTNIPSSFQPNYGPGVDSASNRNECQESS